MLKFIFSLLLFASIVEATTVKTQQRNYDVNHYIRVDVTQMAGNNNDWVGIYPAGASNDWGNVVAWHYTNGITNGKIFFDGLSDGGQYDVRAFFSDSFNLEASYSFNVAGGGANASISSQKSTYTTAESIKINVSNMSGASQDWIGVYKVGASNDWDNVRSWSFTNGLKNGTITLDGVTAGNYEARAFFNNSFNKEASVSFSVKAAQQNATISTQQNVYNAGSSINVSVGNLAGNAHDWVGIYPAGASNDWDNVVTWAYTNGVQNGTITIEGVAAGSYEARVFFNDSFNLEASDSFTVQVVNLGPTVYEDAENGISGDWWTAGGPHTPIRVPNGFNSSGAVQLRVHWITNALNLSLYKLDLHHNRNQFVLDLDVGGVGYVGQPPAGLHSNWPKGTMPHYRIGVMVTTLKGKRFLNWSSWYTHQGFRAHKSVLANGLVQITFPSPLEQWRLTRLIYLWNHHHFDLNAWLRTMEPNNRILSVDTFVATGGNLDNITLSN